MELNRIESWMYNRLHSDATLMALVRDVISGVDASDTAYPIVQFQQQVGEDVNGLGARRIMASCAYLVRVIGEGGSFEAIKSAADRVDALLHGAVGVDVMGCYRETPFQMQETDPGGQLYAHLGGIYRIYAR